ncbi:MAG: hypothetical protein QW117_00365 [Candidatus Pacearchaeota archaeon]
MKLFNFAFLFLFLMKISHYENVNLSNSNMSKLEEEILSETQKKYFEISKKYLDNEITPPKPVIKIKKNKNGGIIEKKIYYCAGYVQQFFLNYFGKNWCIEKGLIKEDGKNSGGTWDIVKSMEEKGYLFWSNKDPKIAKLKEEYRKAFKKNDEKLKEEITIKLAKRNRRYIENYLKPFDILSLWYKDSHYKENDLTHLCVYLGDRKVLQQWGEKIEIIDLNILYERTPAGIERVFRLIK